MRLLYVCVCFSYASVAVSVSVPLFLSARVAGSEEVSSLSPTLCLSVSLCLSLSQTRVHACFVAMLLTIENTSPTPNKQTGVLGNVNIDEIPDGDVLVHAGDLTNTGGLKEIREFCSWMATLPHQHKIVIAGNHDITLDPE